MTGRNSLANDVLRYPWKRSISLKMVAPSILYKISFSVSRVFVGDSDVDRTSRRSPLFLGIGMSGDSHGSLHRSFRFYSVLPSL